MVAQREAGQVDELRKRELTASESFLTPRFSGQTMAVTIARGGMGHGVAAERQLPRELQL